LIDEYLTQGGNAHGIDADTLDREARLVAAAPDLLTALEDLLDASAEALSFLDRDTVNHFKPLLFNAETAIAKARGA
jgi:hypothetical protein